MIQNQLVDYITTQTKLGVSRDTIKSSLVGVGWQAADVEDSLKKVEGDMKPASSTMGATTTAQPQMASVKPMSTMSATATASPVTASPAMSSMGQGMSAAKPATSSPTSAGSFSSMNATNRNPQPAMGSASPATASPMGTSGSTRSPMSTPASQPMKTSDFMGSASNMGMASGSMSTKMDKISGNTFSSGTMPSHAGRGERIGMIVEAIGIVALAALSIYFYTQNSALSAKITALGAGVGTTSSQVTDLQGQLQSLTTTNASLQSQVNDLTTKNTNFTTELSFIAIPAGMTATSTATTTITGTLATSASAKGAYTLRTTEGIVIYVKNGSDPKVVALVKPLVASSATLGGSYVIGSDQITVTDVNGSPVNPPVIPVMSTSTATSTTPASTTTP